MNIPMHKPMKVVIAVSSIGDLEMAAKLAMPPAAPGIDEPGGLKACGACELFSRMRGSSSSGRGDGGAARRRVKDVEK